MSRCARGVVRTRAIERVEVATDHERGDSKGGRMKLEGVGVTQPARHGPYQLPLKFGKQDLAGASTCGSTRAFIDATAPSLPTHVNRQDPLR